MGGCHVLGVQFPGQPAWKSPSAHAAISGWNWDMQQRMVAFSSLLPNVTSADAERSTWVRRDSKSSWLTFVSLYRLIRLTWKCKCVLLFISVFPKEFADISMPPTTKIHERRNQWCTSVRQYVLILRVPVSVALHNINHIEYLCILWFMDWERDSYCFARRDVVLIILMRVPELQSDTLCGHMVCVSCFWIQGVFRFSFQPLGSAAAT